MNEIAVKGHYLAAVRNKQGRVGIMISVDPIPPDAKMIRRGPGDFIVWLDRPQSFEALQGALDLARTLITPKEDDNP